MGFRVPASPFTNEMALARPIFGHKFNFRATIEEECIITNEREKNELNK